jgi:hypothetical protein
MKDNREHSGDIPMTAELPITSASVLPPIQVRRVLTTYLHWWRKYGTLRL